MKKLRGILVLVILALLLIGCTRVQGTVTGKQADGVNVVRYYVTLDDSKTIEVSAQVFYSVRLGQECTFETYGDVNRPETFYNRVNCDD